MSAEGQSTGMGPRVSFEHDPVVVDEVRRNEELARLTGDELDDLHAGLPVWVAFIQPDDGDPNPVSGPAG